MSSSPQVPLAELFRNFPLELYTPIPAIAVSGVSCDSRKAQAGDVFVVLSGHPSDGHCYIPDAVERGVSAVVGVQPLEDVGVPYIRVSNSRQALAHLAAAWYGFPASQLKVIGVTGTDGKTTTTNLIFSILQAAGLRAGLVSTVNAVIGDQVLDTGFHVTTPDAPDVQHYLSQMVAAGLTHAVLETTSHGLAQHRVDACNFSAAAVTNITHEHLDFHGSYEGYRAAKGRLFEMLSPGGVAVLNRDDDSYEYLASLVRSQRMVTYGFAPQADLRPVDIAYRPDGVRFTAVQGSQAIPIESCLLGDFNISNILAALSVTVCGLGIAADAARQGVAALKAVPGRMEVINLGQEFIALVDFAHTPNALRVAVKTARQLFASGATLAAAAPRVITVFGSAGLRDRAKRRMMAEISAELADVSILTAEDPRTEALADILAEMAAAATARGGEEGRTFWRIPDRGEAIRFALSLARPGDVVMACGKGHEQSMCFGNVEYPWDDRLAMRAALSDLLHIPGPQMPFLPTRK